MKRPELPIQMVDLKRQYARMKNEIDAAIQTVVESTAFIRGAQVQQFADHLAKYLGVEHVIPCGNGTDALQLALMALDLKPGEEVIVPAFSFIATAEVVSLLGLKPVFADVDPHTFNIDPASVEEKITAETRAIIPVHLFGQGADLNRLLGIAKKHNLFIIEDTAQALGSTIQLKDGTTKKLGTVTVIGCTSFFPSKNLGCFGDGGALFTHNEIIAQKIKALANHGMEIRYHHDYIGVNSRLDTLQAAVLDVKLKYLDEFNAARKRAAAFYDQAFAGLDKVRVPVISSCSDHVFHQYTLVFDESVDRDRLKERLQEKGIPSMVYYPVPLHLQEAFHALGHVPGDLPVSEALCKRVLSLPMHTELTQAELEYIAGTVIEEMKI